MRFLPAILCVLSAILLPNPGWAQSKSGAPADYWTTLLNTHPGAVHRSDPSDGSLELLTGLRIGGFDGTPVEVASKVLTNLLDQELTTSLTEGLFEAVRIRDTRAGGRRIVLRRAGDPSDPGYLVGVNRTRAGERLYVNGTGSVAPPGYVFVVSSDTMDYTERRSDWYVYFVMKMSEAPEPLLAEAKETETQRHSLAGATSPRSPFDIHDSPLTASDFEGASASRRSTCPSEDFSFAGTGDVYITNPNLGDPQLVELPNLCNQAPVILDGRYVSVTPETDPRPSSANGTFLFDPENVLFDDVSAYFHVDRFLTQMNQWGFPDLFPDWKIDVITRSTQTPTAISGYTSQKLFLGIPTPPYRNAALEAALIAHEITHILFFAYVNQSYFGWGDKQHWAMGESYADYLSLVYRSRQLGNADPWMNPVFGDYVAMELSQDLPRDLTSPTPHFSGYAAINYVGLDNIPAPINLYDNSIIFSSALMDYDRTDDSDNSVSFVIESLFNIPDIPTFRKGRDALMIAASECAVSQHPETYECCESGVCHEAVAVSFANRGIGEVDEGILTAAESEIGNLFPQETVLSVDRAYPNPFNTMATIGIKLARPERVRMDVFEATGRLVANVTDGIMPAGRHALTWTPSDVPSGTYFFEISAGTAVKRGSFVYVK